MTATLAVLGLAWSALAWAVGTVAGLTPLPAWLVWGLTGLWLYGHFQRPVEFAARRVRMRTGGFRRYSEYVASPVWAARRSRWYRENGNAPCCVCARRRDGREVFHLHHQSRIRAGSGREANRDLVSACHSCHTLIHKVERKLYLLGFTLRATTWTVRHAGLPVRLARRAVARRVVTS